MLRPGIRFERKQTVSERDVITFLGDEVTPSLSTPSMISGMEFAARDAVLPNLEAGQDTVGTRVDVSHLAPAPIGAEVTYRATLANIDGRHLTFEVEAVEGGRTVGQGTHERFIIDVQRFAEGLQRKFAQSSSG